jgi:hypothetical protein
LRATRRITFAGSSVDVPGGDGHLALLGHHLDAMEAVQVLADPALAALAVNPDLHLHRRQLRPLLDAPLRALRRRRAHVRQSV